MEWTLIKGRIWVGRRVVQVSQTQIPSEAMTDGGGLDGDYGST